MSLYIQNTRAWGRVRYLIKMMYLNYTYRYVTVSQLVEILGVVAERNKKLFNEIVNKYKLDK